MKILQTSKIKTWRRLSPFLNKIQKNHYDAEYNDGCYLIFGKETKGLSKEILEKYPEGMVRIPMVNEDRIRSLNLSNSVAVAVYEAIRQIGPENMRDRIKLIFNNTEKNVTELLKVLIKFCFYIRIPVNENYKTLIIRLNDGLGRALAESPKGQVEKCHFSMKFSGKKDLILTTLYYRGISARFPIFYLQGKRYTSELIMETKVRMEKMIIITNNSNVKEFFEPLSRYDVEFIEGGYGDVLYKTRDYVHKNYKLLTHPLSGSINQMRLLINPLRLKRIRTGHVFSGAHR